MHSRSMKVLPVEDAAIVSEEGRKKRAVALKSKSLNYLRTLPPSNQAILLRGTRIGQFFHVFLFMVSDSYGLPRR